MVPQVAALAVKLGERGSLLYVGDQFQTRFPQYAVPPGLWYQKAHSTQVVDTTGAGDAFNAAFTAALLNQAQPGKILRYANLIASKVVATRGASPLDLEGDLIAMLSW